MIEVFGFDRVKMPYARHLRGKLWEMRAQGRDGIARSIYVATAGSRVIILRAFVKKTPTTPQSEIELALQRASARAVKFEYFTLRTISVLQWSISLCRSFRSLSVHLES
ncbi:MAG: type II toxin-antitoxin system RelE/ParE family toxin [Desulfovibrio sp.]|jgi:hypothetical protein|nr:type II toxin-antitoxin system RelE/ParE family toxin [Desulfovibrio sp.]